MDPSLILEIPIRYIEYSGFSMWIGMLSRDVVRKSKIHTNPGYPKSRKQDIAMVKKFNLCRLTGVVLILNSLLLLGSGGLAETYSQPTLVDFSLSPSSVVITNSSRNIAVTIHITQIEEGLPDCEGSWPNHESGLYDHPGCRKVREPDNPDTPLLADQFLKFPRFTGQEVKPRVFDLFPAASASG
jgi:hypothetical protein